MVPTIRCDITDYRPKSQKAIRIRKFDHFSDHHNVLHGCVQQWQFNQVFIVQEQLWAYQHHKYDEKHF